MQVLKLILVGAMLVCTVTADAEARSRLRPRRRARYCRVQCCVPVCCPFYRGPYRTLLQYVDQHSVCHDDGGGMDRLFGSAGGDTSPLLDMGGGVCLQPVSVHAVIQAGDCPDTATPDSNWAEFGLVDAETDWAFDRNIPGGDCPAAAGNHCLVVVWKYMNGMDEVYGPPEAYLHSISANCANLPKCSARFTATPPRR